MKEITKEKILEIVNSVRACAKFSVNTEEMWYNRKRTQEGREKWEDQGNPRR